tara:strand:- start:3489 stop:3995 length:507 start_codon:yes stop_codon:yes gene_type:complete
MSIDNLVMGFMQSIQSPGLIKFSEIISLVFDPFVIILASLIISIFLYFKKPRQEGIFFVFVILITGVLVKVVKAIFQRARPLIALVQESGFSFPSGHMTMSIVFLVLIAYLFVSKRNRLWAILIAIGLACLIGFTRLSLQVHWLTDVLGGLVLGGLILILSIIIYKRL